MPDVYHPLRHFIAKFPGSKLCHPTVSRWIARGVKTPTGVIRLCAKRLGGRWVIAEEAFEAFMTATTNAALGAAAAPGEGHAVQSPAPRQKAVDASSAELDALGVR
jgi:hypothetical protein